MKLVSLLSILLLSVACGQKSGSSPSQAEKGCNLNGNSVPCASVTGADGQGVDLLEAMVDVPVKIDNGTITFLADKSSASKGRRIDCSVNIKNGETYRYSIDGDSMMVMTPEGTFTFQKTSDGDDILGSWYWKGYVNQGTHIIRQLSVLSQTRIIVRETCEL